MKVISRYEKNSMRKSYRTSIPLRVLIADKTYHAIDWSLTGLALQHFENSATPGDEIDAFLQLQLEDILLSLPVRLKYEYREGERYGFSFVSLSEKNRAILRRFIDLAIEGDVENVENILALYYEPKQLPAVEERLSLEKEEKRELERAFWRTAWRYILFALLLFALLGALLFYHFRYIYEGSGIVTGNDVEIYPHRTAVVERLYVREESVVEKGEPLADLDSSDLRYQIDLLRAKREKMLHTYEEAQKRYRAHLPPKSEIDDLLVKNMEQARRELQQARKQYRAHLITRLELRKTEQRYLSLRLKREKSRQEWEIAQQRYLQNAPVKPDTTDIDVKIAHLKKVLANYRILAPKAGKVFDIYVTEGQMAAPGKPLMTLWTQQLPMVKVEIPRRYMHAIHIGSRADLIDRSAQRHYRAKVMRFGAKSELTGADGVPVWLSLESNATRLQPYQRLDVLFHREF